MSDTISDIRVSSQRRSAETPPDGARVSGEADPARDENDGRQLEKYKLIEEVGQGGMAVVYRGFDTSLQREVAVKILHPHLAKEEESKQRFQREAHAVAKLRHDNILEIYDYSGLNSKESFIVTEFIHGKTLKAFLNRSPISHPEIAAMIVHEVANALEHAHSFGIIHRDIKPENIMIRRDGRVKLTDFGIAQIIDVQKLTVTGQLLGSPAYMAPELVKGRPLDFRSDVFSMGTLLYQLATGEMPFKGRNPHEVLKRIADGNYVTPQVANPVVDAKMGRIVRKALAHDPDERYQTVAELREDLLAFLSDVEITRPRKELGVYFADTASYSRTLQERVVSALTARGKQALERGDKAQALSFFDRVLCTDPRNGEVLELLEHLSRQRRIGRTIVVLLLFGALGAGSWAAALFWPDSPAGATIADGGVERALSADSRRAPTPLDARRDLQGRADQGRADLHAADAQPADVQAADRRADHLTWARKRPRVVRGGVQKIVRTKPSRLIKRLVEVLPHPKAVTIFLGGKKLGDYGPDLRRITIPPGAQVLTFRNEHCCFDKVVRLAADASPKQLRVRLAWKPARLKVLIEPARVKAAIAVGKVVATAGRSVSVPIPQSSLDGRINVDVKVTAPGYAAVSRKIPVRANASKRVTVILQRAK